MKFQRHGAKRRFNGSGWMAGLAPAALLALASLACLSPAAKAAPPAFSPATAAQSAATSQTITIKDLNAGPVDFPTRARELARAVVYLRCRMTIRAHDKYEGGEIARGGSTSSGSGFFISPRGHLITNAHVVAPPSEETPGETLHPSLKGRTVRLTFHAVEILAICDSGTENERAYPALVIQMDREADLAILHVPAFDRSWLQVAEDREMKGLNVGESACLIGFPGGEAPKWVFEEPGAPISPLAPNGPEPTLHFGRISSLRHDAEGGLQALQLDIRANPGNSGGPVVNEEGRVIGILTAKLRGSTSLDFAIPAPRIRRFAETYLGGTAEPAPMSYEDFLKTGVIVIENP